MGLRGPPWDCADALRFCGGGRGARVRFFSPGDMALVLGSGIRPHLDSILDRLRAIYTNSELNPGLLTLAHAKSICVHLSCLCVFVLFACASGIVCLCAPLVCMSDWSTLLAWRASCS